MSLEFKNLDLPLSFKTKLEKSEKRSDKLALRASQVSSALVEYINLWKTMKPLVDMIYNEAISDNGKYKIGLKIPDLPDPTTSIASKAEYLQKALYIILAVSHCKSISLDRYESIDIQDILNDLERPGTSSDTSKVSVLDVAAHVANVKRIFGDEDVEGFDSSSEEEEEEGGSNKALVIRDTYEENSVL